MSLCEKIGMNNELLESLCTGIENLEDSIVDAQTTAETIEACVCCEEEGEGEGLTFNLPTERLAGQVFVDGNDVGSLEAGWTAEQLVARVQTVDATASVLSATQIKSQAAQIRVGETVLASKGGA